MCSSCSAAFCLQRLHFPAADVRPGHALDEVVLRQAEREHLALAAAEVELHLPVQPQAVLAHVEHGGRIGRQALIDLSLAHLGPPLDVQLPAGGQGRFDRLVGLSRLVSLPIQHVGQPHFRLSQRGDERQRRGRRAGQAARGHPPSPLTLQLQADLQRAASCGPCR